MLLIQLTLVITTLEGSVKLWVHPWVEGDPNKIHFEDADIFVGHGIVSSSVDPHGYKFLNVDSMPINLLRSMSLSIIGDIHNAQWVNDKGSDSWSANPK